MTAAMFLTAVWRLRRGDGALVVTTPPLLPYAIALAARLRGAKPVLLIHDVYPDILVPTGIANSGSALFRVLARGASFLYRSVSCIVVIGRDMEELVKGRRGNSATPVVRITNWGDVDLVVPTPRGENQTLKELGLVDRFVVQFMGNIGRPQGVDDLFAAAQSLADDPKIHFLVIGWGSRRPWLEEHVAAAGLGNVTILPPRRRLDSVDLHNACDIALLPLKPEMWGLAVPSRLYNVLSAGKPIIAVADETSELALVVKEERVGWVAPPSRVTSIVQAIQEASHSTELGEMGTRARRAAEAAYTLERVVSQYEELFANLLSGRPVEGQ